MWEGCARECGWQKRVCVYALRRRGCAARKTRGGQRRGRRLQARGGRACEPEGSSAWTRARLCCASQRSSVPKNKRAARVTPRDDGKRAGAKAAAEGRQRRRRATMQRSAAEARKVQRRSLPTSAPGEARARLAAVACVCVVLPYVKAAGSARGRKAMARETPVGGKVVGKHTGERSEGEGGGR